MQNLSLGNSIKNPQELNENNFNQDLQNQLFSKQPKDCFFWKSIIINFIRTCTSKEKLLCANHAAYVIKALREAIMRRSYLEKLYFEKKTPRSLKKYKKQKYYCNTLCKKERKTFFDKIIPIKVSYNRSFGKISNLDYQKMKRIGIKYPLLIKMKIPYIHINLQISTNK